MKKIISIILAAAMLLSMSLCLFSCGDKENGGDGDQTETEKKVTYTVTVLDENGNPVSGVMVEFAPKGGESFPVKTKSEGKASTTTTKELSAKIIAVPDEYEYDNIGTALTFDANGKVTVTLKKAEVARLTIRVIDNEGNPIEGVVVQMCSTVCKTPVVTDENGEAFYIYEEGFKAQLTMTIPEDATPDEIKAIVEQTLPEGYTVDDPTAKYEFIDGVATIVLTKVN